MKTILKWLFPVIPALICLACFLPSLQNPEDLLQKQAEALNALRLEELELGEMHDWDSNGDGIFEKFEYVLPIYEVYPDVSLEQSMFMEVQGDQGYFPGYTYHFRYLGDDEATFDYIIEIPKEVAVTVDELKFSIPPDRIVDPDIKVEYTLRMGTGAKRQMDMSLTIVGVVYGTSGDDKTIKQEIMEERFEYAWEACDIAYPRGYDNDRNACFLNIVEDFKNYIDHDKLIDFCFNMDSLRSGMCTAILNADINACEITTLNDDEKDLCKGYFIANLCDEFQGEEKVFCLAQNAVDFDSPLACMTISVNDIRLDCLAHTTKDKDYCDQIKDNDLRQTCKGDTGEVKETPSGEDTEEAGDEEEEPERTEEVKDKKIRYSDYEWFPPENAEADCAAFSKIMTDFPISWVDGEGTKLWCNWGPGKDWSSTKQAINIHLSKSDKEARVHWESNYGKESDFWLDTEDPEKSATIVNAQHTGDWVFVVSYDSSGTTYIVNAAALNGNAIIVYDEWQAKIIDPSRFDAILEAADVLIMQKRNE